ncbi:hypothetical protein R1flu_014613 [Riccia fluitans]|uniref:Uncharacterized protein n=1 Tax=Riccia fluitans TaxID=41844 RepID=A0ABD1YGQ2_9MARC
MFYHELSPLVQTLPQPYLACSHFGHTLSRTHFKVFISVSYIFKYLIEIWRKIPLLILRILQQSQFPLTSQSAPKTTYQRPYLGLHSQAEPFLQLLLDQSILSKRPARWLDITARTFLTLCDDIKRDKIELLRQCPLGNIHQELAKSCNEDFVKSKSDKTGNRSALVGQSNGLTHSTPLVHIKEGDEETKTSDQNGETRDDGQVHLMHLRKFLNTVLKFAKASRVNAPLEGCTLEAALDRGSVDEVIEEHLVKVLEDTSALLRLLPHNDSKPSGGELSEGELEFLGCEDADSKDRISRAEVLLGCENRFAGASFADISRPVKRIVLEL